MAYLVLARKHRPRTFSEMVGQEHVVQALENALTSQRLHHAYLFTGTRGVGKTTVSRILAKSLNCQGPDGEGGITAAPCGVCQACQDIDAGRFVDYTELDAASNRGVDEVQALLEQAVYKPVQGRFKVFMIDEVHMLTGHAFNAMLKTLEEPPEYLKFVLATTDPQKVPVTVLSRCLQFNLRPMAPETVLEHLTRVLQAETVPAEPHALRLIARGARGSMRDALSLTDQAIAFGNGELTEGGVRQMLGSVDRGHVFRLIEALARGDGRTVVETAEGLRRDGLSAASTLEEMTAVLQGMAVLQAVPARAEAVDATDPDAAETARLAAAMPPDETQLLYSLCLHGRSELGLAPDEYAALTMVLLRLLAFKPAEARGASEAAAAEKKTLNEAPAPVSAPARMQSPRPLEDKPAPAAVAPASPGVAPDAPHAAPPGHRLPVREEGRFGAAPVAPDVEPVAAAKVLAMPVRVQPPPGARDAAREAPPVPIEPSEEGDFWYATVTQLVAAEAIAALARELALQSQLVARDVDQWLLRVERESLNQASSREKLQTALAGLGHGVKLAIEIGAVADSPARRNKQAAEARQREAEEAIRSDPDVQSMMRDWDARIVPGSLKPA
ncbi:DNA polymerase III subunit gamma/tau [Variovorax sp. JS1663]|uniref:DNA polymerase III subunit gamma/tau n=1 Tax=Variovorax sp. JS1663 TaxID=1851577 RepID=UPI000B3446CD|nr:DNA polymerase III subunit gamma/tau [Variovorax sp. JS1663]OUM02750.1 DNA polymerase III, subunit gamma and tau [Variovorax sp. JS1663]